MKTQNTKTKQHNQTTQNQETREYLKKAEYSRPVYFQDEHGNRTVERFLSYDHARDEARTVAIKIIKHCRRKGIGIDQFIQNGLLSHSSLKNDKESSIMRKTPPETLKNSLRSLRQFEKNTNKRITAALSIRPEIGWDEKGYFVRGINLVDNPAKIVRKYKENYLVDAF